MTHSYMINIKPPLWLQFDTLKKALTTTPIIQSSDWTLPFKLMCDASNFAVEAMHKEVF